MIGISESESGSAPLTNGSRPKNLRIGIWNNARFSEIWGRTNRNADSLTEISVGEQPTLIPEHLVLIFNSLAGDLLPHHLSFLASHLLLKMNFYVPESYIMYLSDRC